MIRRWRAAPPIDMDGKGYIVQLHSLNAGMRERWPAGYVERTQAKAWERAEQVATQWNDEEERERAEKMRMRYTVVVCVALVCLSVLAAAGGVIL